MKSLRVNFKIKMFFILFFGTIYCNSLLAQESVGSVDVHGGTDVSLFSIPKWTYLFQEPYIIENSQITDDGIKVSIGSQEDFVFTERFQVFGAIGLNTTLDYKTVDSYIKWGDGTTAGILGFHAKHESSERPIMSLDGDNGFVGIGTMSPGYNLDIFSSYLPSFSLSNANGRFLLGIAEYPGHLAPGTQTQDIVFKTNNTGSHDGMMFNIDNDLNDGSGYIKFSDNYNLTTFSIFNNGRIGVRNDEPQAVVDIGQVGDPGEKLLKVGDIAGISCFTVLNNGKVGINTSSPQAIFDIPDNDYNAGDVLIKVGNDAYITDVDEGNTLGLYGYQNPEIGLIKLGSTGPVLFGGNGRFGIGTEIPQADLHVNGTVVIGDDLDTPAGYALYVKDGILAEKVKVAVPTTANWSDHVFSKDYKLMGIAELEAFISDHGHLPGIPSADDVVEEGIDLLEMNAKLLEKVEELSLYLIMQRKEIELLKEKIDSYE